MSLKITAITRTAPLPCQHVRVTVNDNGAEKTFQIHLDEIRDRDELNDYGPVVALCLLWAKYKLKNGATAASLVNVEIA